MLHRCKTFPVLPVPPKPGSDVSKRNLLSSLMVLTVQG